MKKLVGLLCIMSQLLIGGEHQSYVGTVELIATVIHGINNELQGLAQQNSDLNSFLLMKRLLGKSPAEIASEKRYELLLLASTFRSGQITVEQFEAMSYNFYTSIPIIVRYDGAPRVAFQYPQEDGTIRYRMPRLR